MKYLFELKQEGKQPEPGMEVVMMGRYNECVGVVKRVTPSGQVIVERTGRDAITLEFRFNAQGQELSRSDFNRNFLNFDVEGWKAGKIAEAKRCAAAGALNLVSNVASEHQVRPTWGKDTMLERLEALEVAIAQARVAVEALQG